MMLSKDLSTVKLADFGMSKKINQAERETMINKGHTGTLRYMAPEVVAKATAHYNEKADIYSAAIIIWYNSDRLKILHSVVFWTKFS
jgi:serine/threonine protein kinase